MSRKRKISLLDDPLETRLGHFLEPDLLEPPAHTGRAALGASQRGKALLAFHGCV